MSSSKINATILLLKSKAVETYGIIKDRCDQPTEQGDSEFLAARALELVQFEGAMLTLQQYSEDLLSGPTEEEPPEEPTEVFVEEEEEKTITVNEDNSPTFRRSQQNNVRKGE